MPALVARAPAKVNLTLHVLGRREADGYHELESLVAFAATGDTLALDPGQPLSLAVEGPTAGPAGPPGDNLVLRAACHLAARVPGLALGAFRLVKRLPVAAGIGGGSSDAAAGLRLLARLNGLAPDHPALSAAARATGADVPVCLATRARMMRGAGEVLGPPLALPPLPAVLANPGVPVETPPVFRALGLAPGARHRSGEPHPALAAGPDADALLTALRSARQRPGGAGDGAGPGHRRGARAAARRARLPPRAHVGLGRDGVRPVPGPRGGAPRRGGARPRAAGMVGPRDDPALAGVRASAHAGPSAAPAV